MLACPMEYHAAKVLLMATPTGRALLTSPRLSGVRGVGVPNLGYYGMAVSPDQLQLNTAAGIPDANKACVLAHELTHCHDLSHWGLYDRDRLTSELIAYTEINAHFNQGLVARQLRDLAAAGVAGVAAHGASITAMCGANTTFGWAVNWATRGDVYRYLETTAAYGPNVRTIREGLYLMFVDSEWEAFGEPFHCDEHLDANQAGRTAFHAARQSFAAAFRPQPPRAAA